MHLSPPAVKHEIKQFDADFVRDTYLLRLNSIATLKHSYPKLIWANVHNE